MAEENNTPKIVYHPEPLPAPSPAKNSHAKSLADALAAFGGELMRKVEGYKDYLASGFEEWDKLLDGGPGFGQLLIAAGRPAMGKTSFGLQVARNIAAHGRGVMVFSLEMGHSEIVIRLLSWETGIPGSRIKHGKLTEDEWPVLAEAMERMSQWPMHIDCGSQTPQSISAKCRSAHKKLAETDTPLGLVLIDYLQLVTGKGANRTLEVSEVTRTLKLLAMDCFVPVLAISQLNRGVEQRDDKRPGLADLRESGAIEQDADSVTMIYRGSVYEPENPAMEGLAEAIVRKNRHGEIGTAHLAWVGSRAMFGNLAPGYVRPTLSNGRVWK